MELLKILASFVVGFLAGGLYVVYLRERKK